MEMDMNTESAPASSLYKIVVHAILAHKNRLARVSAETSNLKNFKYQ